jgi:hypothetical protein
MYSTQFYPKRPAKVTAGKPSRVTAGKPWDEMGKKIWCSFGEGGFVEEQAEGSGDVPLVPSREAPPDNTISQK